MRLLQGSRRKVKLTIVDTGERDEDVPVPPGWRRLAFRGAAENSIFTKVPHGLSKFTTADEDAGGPSSTRPKRRARIIGLSGFGPPNSYSHESVNENLY